MSTEKLYLRAAPGDVRNVLDEPVASFGFDFSDGEGKSLKHLMNAGYIGTSNVHQCAVGGVIMGTPDYNMPDMNVLDWGLVGTGWVNEDWQPAPFPRDDMPGNTLAFAFRGAGAWAMTSKEPFAAGRPFWMRWVTYANQKVQAQPDSSDLPVTIYFGVVWRVRLQVDGRADLSYRMDDTKPFSQVACWDWMAEGQYSPMIHWLWIYEIGPQLVIRSVMQAEDGKPRGVKHLDPAPEGAMVPGLPVFEDLGFNAMQPQYTPHALHRGQVQVTGKGSITLALAEQTFLDGVESSLWSSPFAIVGDASDLDDLGHGKSTAAVVRLTGTITDTSEATPLVETFDQSGEDWPQAPDAPLVTKQPGFAWKVSWPNTVHSSCILSSINITLPATTRVDTASSVDLYATAGAAVREVRVTRDPDLSRDTASVNALAYATNLTGYVRENMPVKYVVDEVTRFRGLSTGGDWHTIVDFSDIANPKLPAKGDLKLHVQGLWKRFTKARWKGGQPGDGRLLKDVLTEVVKSAGLADTDLDIDSTIMYQIPNTPVGSAPVLHWKSGVTIDHILLELREKFFGTDYQMYFDLATGKFTVRYLPASDVVKARFYELSQDAANAGHIAQVIAANSYEDSIDATELANVVTVVGEDVNHNPLLAQARDWPSIQGNGTDTPPRNFVGEEWPLVVFDPGLGTQGAVNWVCDTLFQKVRWPRIYAKWKSIRVDVFPGDVVTLVGAHYNTNWRLKGVELEKSYTGPAHWPAGQASYAAELIGASS